MAKEQVTSTAEEKPMMFSRAEMKQLLIPLLLEQALTVMIGMMDTIMVAGCGEAAVSGVSLVDTINLLLSNVFAALATGGAVVASQYLGKKDPEEAGRSAKMLFYVILIASTAIMTLCLIFRVSMLDAIYGTIEADVMESARTYLFWSAVSYPFLAMYNASAALLRSMGNAKISLETSLVMNVVNVIGNSLLIYVMNMGVAGAAIATLVSRILGAAVMQIALQNPRCTIPYPKLHELEWHSHLVKKILYVGVPNGLEGSIFQLGKLILLGLVSTFGTVSIAANAVGNTMASLEVLPGNAIGLGMITVVGQCVGAHEFKQARMYVKRMMMLAYASMAALNVIILLSMDLLVIPFNLSAETAEMAKKLIAIHGLGSIFIWPMAFVLPNALRAAGDATFTMAISIFSMAAFRVFFGYILAQNCAMGVVGVWLAMVIDWVFRSTLFLIRMKGNRWESKVLV